MGKTEKGAVWLDKELLSSFDYWQFWRNTDDRDVINYLKLFTELSEEEIEKLSKLDGANINEAKIILANEATKMLHGKEEAEKALETSKKTFDDKSFDENLPTLEIKKNELEKGISLKEIISEIWMFIGVLIIALIIMTLFPGLILWLPEMFGYKA